MPDRAQPQNVEKGATHDHALTAIFARLIRRRKRARVFRTVYAKIFFPWNEQVIF
jgi:hypothetical protein